jgi:hypothetical protein
MNNKGFGVINILIFAIFAMFAIFVFYSFITGILGFIPESHIPNYTNEYRKYFKSAISNDATLMSNNNTNKIEYNSYSDMEVAVSKATKKYIADFYTTLYDNDPLYIKITTLQSYDYIDTLEDVSNSNIICTGYTKVIKTGNNVTYNAYINCGDNYTTEDYISRLDN